MIINNSGALRTDNKCVTKRMGQLGTKSRGYPKTKGIVAYYPPILLEFELFHG